MVSGALEAHTLSLGYRWFLHHEQISIWTAEFNFNHLQSNKQSVISILGLLLVSKQLGAQSPRNTLCHHSLKSCSVHRAPLLRNDHVTKFANDHLSESNEAWEMRLDATRVLNPRTPSLRFEDVVLPRLQSNCLSF